TATPPMKMPTLATANSTAARGGTLPSHTTRRPKGPARKSRPRVGDWNSRRPRMESGRMIEPMQMAAMPTASSSPKSRSIGTLAKWSAAKAKMASKVTPRSEVAGALLDRVLGAVDHPLLLDARVHLDRVVDPDAEHHREPGDGHDGQRD